MNITVKCSKLSQEEEVRRTRNFLQTVIDGIPDQVMVVDLDYRIVLANRAVRKTTGETDSVSEGMLCYQVSHHRDSPCEELEHPCPLKKVFTTGKPVTVIHTHYDTGGNRIFVEINVSPIFNDSGEVVHIIEALRDITERKQAQEELRESEERLRLAQASANVGIWDWNVQTGQLNWTKELEALYGYVPGTFPHNYAGFSDHVHPDDLADVEARRDEAVADHRPFDLEFRILLPSGMVRWANVKGAAKYDETGAPLHVYGVHSDITERKQAEEQIKSSLKEKELLLKEVYHRTKNNFQVISSMLYLQSEYAGDKKVSDILDKCYDRIKSMAAVHEHLYKSEDFTHIDFAEYVRDLLVSLYRSYGISEKTIAFQVNIDNIFLGLDMAVPCGLIINELISNSLKHAFGRSKKRDRENAKICVDMHKTDGRKLILIVDDNGSGLAGDLNSMNGQTFGLYLIKNLAKQLDGTVELNTDNGTKFTITFPHNME